MAQPPEEFHRMMRSAREAKPFQIMLALSKIKNFYGLDDEQFLRIVQSMIEVNKSWNQK